MDDKTFYLPKEVCGGHEPVVGKKLTMEITSIEDDGTVGVTPVDAEPAGNDDEADFMNAQVMQTHMDSSGEGY
jgi:hypothetical protein